jgi:hypothetical protein
MKGFVVVYPGTSGHISSDFGLFRSLGPIANLLVSEGYGVLAFRQAIYNKSDDPVARLPFLEHYKKLENNLTWVMQTIEFANSFLPQVNGRPAVPFHFISRSTGTGVGLEALHRFSKGDSRYRSISLFQSMLLMSVDGHTPDAIEKWHSAEVREFIYEKPLTGDAPVVMASPGIFRDMRWQTEFVPSATMANTHLPLVYLTVGSRDEFSAPSISLRPIIDFSRNHPGLFTGLLFHDGFHNPNRAIPKVDGAGTMTRTAQLLSYLLYPYESRPHPGFHAAFTPTLEMVFEPLNEEERRRCHHLLVESGAFIPHGRMHP